MLICNICHEKLEDIREKLFELGIPGLTIAEIKGIGKPRSQLRGVAPESTRRGPRFQPRVEMKIVLEDEAVEEVAQTILNSVKTGNPGDGKFFIMPVEDVIRVRTGERGNEALY